ncbi:MAG: ATP-grasp domain-containing protein [Burkholderiaceae bacterium]|nr:MAG: ATP-grasp domain-containing protein [Burkholderiaceae bacterium]
MKRILITGIGGDISQSVAAIVRENRPTCHLVGADIHQQHGGSLFVDTQFTLPMANDPGYVAALQRLIAMESIDTVIPMTEPELSVIGARIEKFSGVKWIFPGKEVVSECVDKLATAEMLERIGIRGPWTMPVSAGMPDAYPCILKSRLGSGSRAVFIVRDEEEAAYVVKRHPDSIFQELLNPPDQEVTCAVYRTCDGRVATLQMLRRLVGGFTGWAKVINDAQTVVMCETIAHGLDLRGSMNVQLRITDSGPRVFEINPRFSSTTLMRHQLGFSDVLWALDEAEGKSVTFPVIETGKIMVRVQGAAVIS